ncbi:hypothetical protein AAC387_Pa01g4056 [Persea americana]
MERKMRTLAPQLRNYMFGRNATNYHVRRFSFSRSAEELSVEEEAERKVGWLLKLIFLGTVSFAGYHFIPYMGDNLMQHSIKLLQVKDPLFKRMGASRLSRFAIDDERRMKIVEMGGVQELLKMLEGATDDRTRKEAFKALVALSHSGAAAEALHQAGAILAIHSTPASEDAEVMSYKSSLLSRFQDLKYEPISSEAEVNRNSSIERRRSIEFFSLSGKRIYKAPMPDCGTPMHRVLCVSSSHGWLLFRTLDGVKSGFLFNPFNRKYIQLPDEISFRTEYFNSISHPTNSLPSGHFGIDFSSIFFSTPANPDGILNVKGRNRFIQRYQTALMFTVVSSGIANYLSSVSRLSG